MFNGCNRCQPVPLKHLMAVSVPQIIGNQENALHTNISAADNYVFETEGILYMKVKLFASIFFKIISHPTKFFNTKTDLESHYLLELDTILSGRNKTLHLMKSESKDFYSFELCQKKKNHLCFH